MKYPVFAKLIEQCRNADRVAWSDLVQRYTPLLHQRFFQCFPDQSRKKEEVVKAYFDFLSSQNRLGEFPAANEHEFAISLIFDFLHFCRDRHPLPDFAGTDLVDLRYLFDGFPLAYQKCIYLLLEDFPKDLIQSIFRVGSVLTYSAQEALQEKLAVKNWSSVRISLPQKEQIQQARTEECEGVRVLGSLMEGSLAKSDRDRVQNHLQKCLHCLQNLVTWEEVAHFLRIWKDSGSDPPISPPC